MTEVEWLACTDPTPMLEFLAGRVTARKLRLFGCGCCRCIWHMLGEQAKSGVVALERYSDGLLDDKQLELAGRKVGTELTSQVLGNRGGVAICATTAVVRSFIHDRTEPTNFVMRVVADGAWFAASATGLGIADEPDAKEQKAQAILLRDVVACPLRPVDTDTIWVTPAVVTLAQAIYEERAFDNLPILADTLEQAGCTDAEILAHCRGPGPHVRGCWVVDHLLGKE